MNKDLREKEMLQDLGILKNDVDISVRDLSRVLNGKGVLVDLTLKGGTRYIKMPKPKEDISNESKDFISQHFSEGKITFLNKALIQNFTAIKNTVRHELYKASAIRNGNFIPTSLFPDFKASYNKQKEDFDNLLKDVMDNYDNIKSDFVIKVARYVTEAYKDKELDEQKEIYNQIIEKIPRKEELEGDFEFSMKVFMFSSVGEINFENEELQDLIDENIKNNSLDLIEESLLKALDIIFCNMAPFVNAIILNDHLRQKALTSLKLTLSNNYLESKIVNDLANKAIDLINVSNLDTDVEMEAEKIIAKIYKFFQERNKVSYLKIPKYLSHEYLENIAKIY